MKTDKEHTKKMLRRSILDRKLNEAGIYMNPKLGRYINEAMEDYCNYLLSGYLDEISLLKNKLNHSCNYNKSNCPFTDNIRNIGRKV